MSPLTHHPRAGAVSLIETKDFGDDGTGVTSVSFSAGIDGDNDGMHVLTYRLKLATSRYAYFRPNGLTTNLDSSFWRRDLGKINLAGELGLAQNGGSGTEHVHGWMLIYPKAGVKRQFIGMNSYPEGAATGEVPILWNGLWNETATNITSYTLIASVANGFKADCTASLYKVEITQ